MYRVQSMVIEVTRRCNMACDHCLRGCSEALDIDDKYLDSLFQKLDHIDTLTLTGGEPSLVPEKIRKIVELAKQYQVTIERFYMVTNAKQVSGEFIMAVLDLYLYCDNSDSGYASQLDVSNDHYHLSDISDYNGHQENIKKLKALAFTGMKSREDWETYEDGLIGQGNATENFYIQREYNLQYFECMDEYDISGDAVLYLNCKGMLVADCNLSYDTQDNLPFVQLGHITTENLDILEQCEKYNKWLNSVDCRSLDVLLDEYEPEQKKVA